MGGQYTRRPPDLVIVGSAARDVAPTDPRGWRLGGAVSYGALTAGRLGIRTGALIGVDSLAARAMELDLLRQAGVDVVLAEVAHGPIFHNREEPGGRVQRLLDLGDPLSPDLLPAEWRDASGWLLSPVADELPDAWADVPPADALVGMAWQGILRHLAVGHRVTRRPPVPNALIARADIVGVSVNDVEPGTGLDVLAGFVKPGATILLTHGTSGGLAVTVQPGGERTVRRWPAVDAARTVDPTGAGDVFLAAFLGATANPELAGRSTIGARLRIAATAASFVVEGPGLVGVPELATVRRRASQRRADAAPATGDQAAG
jgi:sugar/nucleoside kinase (ribokinase family)